MFFKYSYIFKFASFHIAIGLMRCDMYAYVNKRDVENKTREKIVQNKLWYINVESLIVDQIMLGKNGQLFSLYLKKKVYVKYGSNW